MSVRIRIFLLVLLLALPSGLGSSALAAEVAGDMEYDLEWRDHLLIIGEITHKADGKKNTQATVELKTVDGSDITKDEVTAYKEDFVLDYQGYSLCRPSSGQAVKGTLKLVFNVRNIPHQDFESEDCIFYVSPIDRGSPEIMGTSLYWKGYRLRLDQYMNDGLAITNMIREQYPEHDSPIEDIMPDLFWSDQFVLVEMTVFSDQKGITLDKGNLYEMAEEIMLTGDDTDTCWPVLTFVRKSSFQAIFIVDLSVPLANLRPTMPDTKPFPAGPLWVGGKWDDDSEDEPAAADVPLSAFVPEYPESYTCVLMLEDASAYEPAEGKTRPRQHMKEAIESLEDDLYVISWRLNYMFEEEEGMEAFSITTDPNEASVIIGVNIQFPYAGKYRDEEDRELVYPAYNYTLVLTAYDAVTYKKIGTLKASNQFSGRISVYDYDMFYIYDNIDDETEGIVQPLPDITESSGRRSFINALNAFWKKWEPPAAN